MAYKYFLFLVLLILISTSDVLATPAQQPPCFEVKNPEHYKDLIYNSDLLTYFQEWQLKNVTVPPCQYGGASIQAILRYDVPKSYSPHNLTYSTEVEFYFIGERLYNADELLQFYRNYKSHVENFENNSAIKLFINITEVSSVNNVKDPSRSRRMSEFFVLNSNQYFFNWDEIPGDGNGKLIEFLKQNYGIDWVEKAKIEKIDGGRMIKISTEKNSLSLRFLGGDYMVLTIDNYMNYHFGIKIRVKDSKLNIHNNQNDYLIYNFTENSIKSFQFVTPKLIENLDLFIPNITKIPQIEEFKRNKDIEYAEYSDDRLTLNSVGSSLTYDLERKSFMYYRLDNNITWETFPKISEAHDIIKEKLLAGELSNCTIRTDFIYGSTEIRSYYDSQDLYITVPLRCSSGKDKIKSKEAHVVLHPDGTYERLQVEGDTIDKITGQNRLTKKSGAYITNSIIIIILIIFYKIKKNQKRGRYILKLAK